MSREANDEATKSQTQATVKVKMVESHYYGIVHGRGRVVRFELWVVL